MGPVTAGSLGTVSSLRNAHHENPHHPNTGPDGRVPGLGEVRDLPRPSGFDPGHRHSTNPMPRNLKEALLSGQGGSGGLASSDCRPVTQDTSDGTSIALPLAKTANPPPPADSRLDGGAVYSCPPNSSLAMRQYDRHQGEDPQNDSVP